MKNLIAVLLVVCVLAVGCIGFLEYKGAADRAPVEEPTELIVEQEPDTPAAPEAQTGDAAEAPQVRHVDFDALYATHEPDEVVLSINGRDVKWDEYFYMLYSQAKQTESYFDNMAMYYGEAEDWADLTDDELSYAQAAVENAEDSLKQVAAIRGFAEANGVELTEEDQAAIDGQLQQDIESFCGVGATEEEFYEALKSIYMSKPLYEQMNQLNYLYQGGFRALYGKDCELISDEQAMQYLADNGYLRSNHILLMTIDPTTYSTLDEEQVKEKLATAEKLVQELRAIEDPQERAARFLELKTEYCEDSGKIAYPEGYTFQPGKMVTEFEEATKALADYEISDPILTTYGYHVIMRLPLTVDGTIEYSNEGTPLTARNMLANEEYAQRLQDYLDSLNVSYAEGFTSPNLLDFVK